MRRNFEEKQTIEEIKEEQRKISDAIMIDRQNLESLQKEIKGFEGIVKKQREVLAQSENEIQQSLKLIQLKTEKIVGLDKEISDKTEQVDKIINELDKVKRISEEMIENGKKEVEQIIQERSGERNQLTIDIQNLEGTKNGLIEDTDKLIIEKEIVLNSLAAGKITSEDNQKQIEKSEFDLGKIKTDIIELLKDKTNLEGLKDEIKTAEGAIFGLNQQIEKAKNDFEKADTEKKEVEQNFSSIQIELENARKELAEINEARKIRSDDLDKREEALKATREGLDKGNIDLMKKEKQIMTLGNTLQKHLDKQQIPIKVFE